MTTIITSLLSGGVVVALIGILGKYLEFKWSRKTNQVTIDNTIATIAHIYELMEDLVLSTPIEHFIIFKAENGGGIPRVGAPIYVSALMEMHKVPLTHSSHDFQRLRIDSEYATLLHEILSNGNITYKVSNMKPSLLRSIYELSDIKEAKVFLLHTTKEAVYYCSIATTSADGLTDKCKTAAELTVSNISNIFKSVIK
jgi:hypothetical protein